MSGCTIELGEQRYELDGCAYDLAIPLRFDGAQPSHFDAPPASATPMTTADGFVGRVRQGGSCNAAALTLNPHCNGTHTECVGHVTREPVSVHDIAPRLPLYAVLVTVTPADTAATDETADPEPAAGDRLLTCAALEQALDRLDADAPQALVVRTLPNSPDKMTRDYREAGEIPYFTLEAVACLITHSIEHVLVDTPSFDRIHDGGRLAGHRLFWGLPPGGSALADAGRADATITEMIYAPDEIRDGVYLLSLQVAPFAIDAAPSRPVLYGLRR